ncbi:MAG: hypothetical protein L0177_06225 [Chloroflexi bacterium]|nr:hypothetical protein [Chloroflexota bacterium]
MLKQLRKALDGRDLVAAAGLLLLALGIGMVHLPSALMVVGAVFLTLALGPLALETLARWRGPRTGR